MEETSTTKTPRQQNLTQEAFLRIPAEIWLLIASHLEPVAASSLVLSSKAIHGHLGTRYWQSLVKQEKIDFLSLLMPTLPDHQLCPQCVIYHPLSQLRNGLLQPSYETTRGRVCQKDIGFVELADGRGIDWWMVQVTMANARRSSSSNVQKHLSHAWSSNSYSQYRSDWHHNTRAAIVNGRLLLRLCSQGLMQRNMEDSRSNEFRFLGEMSCTHMNSALSDLCDEAVYHFRSHSISSITKADCEKVHSCHRCLSEYLIEVANMKGRPDQVQITVTRWIDLGMGESPAQEPWPSLIPTYFDCQEILRRDGVWKIVNSYKNFMAPATNPLTIRYRFETSIRNGGQGKSKGKSKGPAKKLVCDDWSEKPIVAKSHFYRVGPTILYPNAVVV